jgi:hypothetical protein
MSNTDPVTLGESAKDSGLAVLLQAVLMDAAQRHGGQLQGLHSRITIAAVDADEEVTLVLAGGGCVIEAGRVEPDLVLAFSSDLLPRLQAVPTVFGLPLFASLQGLSLLQALVKQPLRVREVGLLFAEPGRAARVLLDVWRLTGMIAGG